MFEFEYDFSNTRLTGWEARILQLAGICQPLNPLPAGKHKKGRGKRERERVHVINTFSSPASLQVRLHHLIMTG